MTDKNTVVLSNTQHCDFCKAEAQYDGKTKMGPWAYMCETHFQMYGIGLGPGRGQKLLYRRTDK
jgi:hypothetical protein